VFAVAVAGCGSNNDYKNQPRPPSPIVLTASISKDKVSVSPANFGAGPVSLIITNLTGAPQEVTFESDAGGSGSTNTSIWLVGWGQKTVHGLFPKGSKAGLQMRDMGEQRLFDSNGNVYQGYSTHFKWDCGLSVRDWRYVVRIANVNVTAGAVTTANLINLLITAASKVPFIQAAGNNTPPGGTKPGAVNFSFYCNRTVRTAFDIQALAKSNALLTLETRDGKPYTAFRGIPIHICDQLLNTEARVV